MDFTFDLAGVHRLIEHADNAERNFGSLNDVELDDEEIWSAPIPDGPPALVWVKSDVVELQSNGIDADGGRASEQPHGWGEGSGHDQDIREALGGSDFAQHIQLYDELRSMVADGLAAGLTKFVLRANEDDEYFFMRVE